MKVEHLKSIPAVYAIVNTATGDMYIGCTKNLRQRADQHRWMLRGVMPQPLPKLFHSMYPHNQAHYLERSQNPYFRNHSSQRLAKAWFEYDGKGFEFVPRKSE